MLKDFPTVGLSLEFDLGIGLLPFPHEVVIGLSVVEGRVTRFLEDLRQKLYTFGQIKLSVLGSGRAVLMRAEPDLARADHHGRPAGRADGSRNVSPVEAHARLGNRIDVRGTQPVGLMAIGSHPRGGVFGKDPDNIGTGFLRKKAANGSRKGNQK